MRISNITALCAAVSCAGLSADELTLSGGASRLTGNVRSIDGAGVVILDSPHSPTPLRLRGAAVDKVEFETKNPPPEPPPGLIELTNGDRIPAGIESMDDHQLTVLSPVGGRIEIPRDALASVQLGVRNTRSIYSGPRSLEEWTENEPDAKNWTFKDGALIADGSATASRDVGLPRRFILRFTLKWQPRQTPNFQVHFADPMKVKGEPCDRYYLQFGGAGLEIKRESATGKRFNTIVQLNRTPNQYTDQLIRVEIRLNRDTSRLHLFINDEPEGEFIDPIAPLPDGSGITLVSHASNGTTQEIRAIDVIELDDLRTRHHAEDRGDPETDSLISREDDRWSGRLIDIRTSNGARVFRFKSDFQDEPMEIPEADVSTVFFASPEDAPAAGKNPPFVLKTSGEGSLSVTSCSFTEDKASAVHPLLGPLEFRRDGITAMERSEP